MMLPQFFHFPKLIELKFSINENKIINVFGENVKRIIIKI